MSISSPGGQQPTKAPTSPSAPPRRGSTPPPRSGRRERQRPVPQQSFVERHRTALVVAASLAGIVLISAFVFVSASQPAFACSTIWSPAPTASPAAGATPALGYVQPIMGSQHVGPDLKVTYTYCAPASGQHINKPPQGPIPARVYGPDDKVIPQGWIHNLEHGGVVILYRGDSAGATPEGQAKFRVYHENFPPIPNCGPVIARFDQMSTPFQVLLWGRVLLMDSFDEELTTRFYFQWAGLTNPEAACPVPNSKASPTPIPTAVPSGSAAPSGSPAASGSAAPSASPATPSSSPVTSASPGASPS